MNQWFHGSPPVGWADRQQGEVAPGAPGGLMLPGGTADNPLAIGLSASPPVITLPMTHVRQVSMTNLELSQRSTTPVTVVSEVDASNLQETYRHMKPQFEATTGIPLTYTAFFVRATVKALLAYPIMNGTLTNQGHIIPRHIHIGFAVQTPAGVYIPAIWHAQSKSIGEVARDLATQTARARAGKIPLNEMTGQTFCITNTGTFGKSLFGTPIIKPPNVGILSFEMIVKRPAVDANDQIVVKPMMYMALTADHRAVDGADMIGFIGKVKESLELLDL